MSSTPSQQRTFNSNPSLGIRLTPVTPCLRNPRSPKRAKSFHEPALRLKRIIGTTVTSPAAFHSLQTSPLFAYTAGAAVVVVGPGAQQPAPVDEGPDIRSDTAWHQRFYRARPTAVPSNAFQSLNSAPSTPNQSVGDWRLRNTITRESQVFAPYSPQQSLETPDSPSSKTWTSRERIKAATCLALSADGNLLAVGETGYSPRVLLFSLQDPSSDIPCAIFNEHTFGVKAVAFSPDQKYLASLGCPNDGFLYVWSIKTSTGVPRMLSSNKCTTFVRHMIWLGKHIITVGTRHIKLWTVTEPRSSSPTKQRQLNESNSFLAQPSPKALSGRNCLLGRFIEATFSCVVGIDDDSAITCTDKGDICFLHAFDNPKLVELTNTGFSITSACVSPDAQKIDIAGKDGRFACYELSMVDGVPQLSPTQQLSFEEKHVHEEGHVCAMGYAGDNFVTIDSKHVIKILENKDVDAETTPSWSTPFPAHGDAAMGVDVLKANNIFDAAFLTWSVRGSVVFWSLDGTSKASIDMQLAYLNLIDDTYINQCQVVKVDEKAETIISGDKFGTLKVLDTTSQECLFETRAHHSEIHGIALYEDQELTLMATCGRDRTIQMFQKLAGMWSLTQTLDEHSAAINDVLFAESGTKLISCSSDRTIHIRQLLRRESNTADILGAIPLRIITLKNSPVSMTLWPDGQKVCLLVSSMDRTVSKFDMANGRLLYSFRATDVDGTDAVVLDALAASEKGLNSECLALLAGVSSTDKSVRIYDGTSGAFLGREWGHTAGVTDVALLDSPDAEEKSLVSTGSDGTIMIWEVITPQLGSDDQHYNDPRDWSPDKDSPMPRPPLRKVLSKAELVELQRTTLTSATPPGRNSPPRSMRRKTSRYALASRSSSLAPQVSSMSTKSAIASDSPGLRLGPRARSRSPPAPRTATLSRRPSTLFDTRDSRSRTKSATNTNDPSTLDMASEQTCKMLRAYRKKLLTSDPLLEVNFKELDQELRLTAVALRERRNTTNKSISDTVLTGLLDQYSDRLVTMFDEKLRVSRQASDASEELLQSAPNSQNDDHLAPEATAT